MSKSKELTPEELSFAIYQVRLAIEAGDLITARKWQTEVEYHRLTVRRRLARELKREEESRS